MEQVRKNKNTDTRDVEVIEPMPEATEEILQSDADALLDEIDQALVEADQFTDELLLASVRNEKVQTVKRADTRSRNQGVNLASGRAWTMGGRID